MSKGILGIGCSFTWGESLYYYSDLENLPVTEYHEFDNSLLNLSMLAYKDKQRYLRRVADYYDTWELVLSKNGGNNQDTFIHTTWNHIIHDEVNITDFKLVIWQITSWEREASNSDIQLQDYHLFLDSNEVDKSMWQEYFDWRENLQEYEVRAQLTFIDEMAKEFESHGVKVITIVWPDQFSKHPAYFSKFKERHVPIHYDNEIYDSFDNLLYSEDNGLTLRSEFKSEGIHKNDIHFGLKGQELLKNSIIKKLEQDNFKI